MTSANNTNEQLIKVLKEIKKHKNPQELALAMDAAHKVSPYKPRMIENLSTSLLNKLDGSTGGYYSEFKIEDVIRKCKF
jgi:hypothetical protein